MSSNTIFRRSLALSLANGWFKPGAPAIGSRERFSVAAFYLAAQGDKTRAKFEHRGFPTAKAPHLKLAHHAVEPRSGPRRRPK